MASNACLKPFDRFSLVPPIDRSWGSNIGGGLNSIALRIECYNRGFRPDWCAFSDTGSEHDWTYKALDEIDAWLVAHGEAPITRVRWNRVRPAWVRFDRFIAAAQPKSALKYKMEDGWLWALVETEFESLEQNCFRLNTLPSKAYGLSGCSSKFKIQPMQEWRAEHGFANTVYTIGFDAGETKRVNKKKCKRAVIDQESMGEEPWYPLYAWKLTRDDCAKIVAAAGLPPVRKSSCFFCPMMKKPEWLKLRDESPALFARALAMEKNVRVNGRAETNGLLASSGWLSDWDGESPLATDTSDVACACYEASQDDEDPAPLAPAPTPLDFDGL